jgi:hypothetical protein
MYGCSSLNGGKQRKAASLNKRPAPEAMRTHCVMHRESLATKEFCPELSELVGTVIRTVNYIKACPLKGRLLQNYARKSVAPVLL